MAVGLPIEIPSCAPAYAHPELVSHGIPRLHSFQLFGVARAAYQCNRPASSFERTFAISVHTEGPFDHIVKSESAGEWCLLELLETRPRKKVELVGLEEVCELSLAKRVEIGDDEFILAPSGQSPI